MKRFALIASALVLSACCGTSETLARLHTATPDIGTALSISVDDGPDRSDPDTDTPADEPTEEPGESMTGKKGNASENNGKGGNYDHTGHKDNGKGNGRDKK